MEQIKGVMLLMLSTVLELNNTCSPVNKSRQHAEDKIASSELVTLYFDSWENGDASFFDLLNEDVEWTVAGKALVSGTYYGKANFIDHAVKPILAQLTTSLLPELLSLTTDGQYVWLHFKAKATAINGKPYGNTYLWKLQLENEKIITGIAFLNTYELAELMKRKGKEKTMDNPMEENGKYIGMWVTENGYIRHDLLPGNRYDEARGNRTSAYRGKYEVVGNHIDYVDDTGFSAEGEFVDERTLHHGGYIFHKVED